MANNFPDSTIVPVLGSDDRVAAYNKAGTHYLSIAATYGYASEVSNALADFIRAEVEIRLRDGAWPSHAVIGNIDNDPGPAY